MSRMMNILSSIMRMGRHPLAAPPTKKQLKADRPPRYKPLFTCGFRGFPKTYTPIGQARAPTIDEVRTLERSYMCRLDVKQGLIYFREDGKAFSHDEARSRRQARMEKLYSDLNDEVMNATTTAK